MAPAIPDPSPTGAVKRAAPPKAKPLGKKMRDGYWTGNLKMFKPHGKGVYEYFNGDKYEGTFSEGKRQTDSKGDNRKAKFTWANGAKYVGQFFAGRCHGEGRLWFPDGTKFFSQNWNKDVVKLESFEFDNGDVYSGEISTWKLQTLHDTGCLKVKNGDVYTGHFSNNLFNGVGEYQCRSGDFYKGTFVDGSPGPMGSRGENGPGEGHSTFPNGDVYYGEFDSGVPHGKGQLRFADGDVVEAEFDRGRWTGTHIYGNGDKHTGNFHLNEPEGGGHIEFRTGGVFDGKFEDGRFNFEVNTGEVHERGQFRDGMLDGQGQRAFGREVYEGEFKFGYYHGAGKLSIEGWWLSGRREQNSAHHFVLSLSLAVLAAVLMLRIRSHQFLQPRLHAHAHACSLACSHLVTPLTSPQCFALSREHFADAFRRSGLSPFARGHT
jgi:hypothetical protein